MAFRIEVMSLLFLASLGIYDGIRMTKVPLPNPDPVGPGWYLIIVSGLLFLCVILYLFIERSRQRLLVMAEKKVRAFSFSINTLGWMLIVLVGYTFATPRIGYAPATAFFFILILHILGMRSWPKSILWGLVFTVVFKLIFSDLAGVSLP